MATAADIGSSSDYTGNVNIGGGDAGVAKIDTKPIEQLAAYTMMFNKSEYDQRQKDADAKVKELADISQISLAGLHGKDRTEMQGKLTDFMQYASDFARKTPADQAGKLQQQVDWQSKKTELLGYYNTAKARTVGYYARKGSINEKYTDAKAQDAAQVQLDKEFDGTDITTPINALPNYKMESADLSKPIVSDIDVIKKGGDEDVATTGKIYLPSQNAALADQTLLNLKKNYPKEGTPEWKDLSENEKSQAKLQGTVDGTASAYASADVPFNQALHATGADGKLLYFDGNGKFLPSKFETDNASNSVVMNAYNGIKRLNDYSQQKINQIRAGQLSDSGYSFSLPTGVSENDFKAGVIDWSKGVSSNQLMQAGMFSQFEGDKFDKKVTKTGYATELKKVAIQQAGENTRAFSAQANSYKIAKLPYEEMKKIDAAKLAAAGGVQGDVKDQTNILFDVKTDPNQNQFIFTPTGSKVVGHNNKPAQIVNGVAFDSDGDKINLDGEYKVPISAIGDQVISEYNKFQAPKYNPATQKYETSGGSIINAEDKMITVRYKNGDITGIKTSSGTFADENQFKTIGDKLDYKGVKKGVPRTNSGVDKGGGVDAGLSDGQYFLKYKKVRGK